MRPILHLSLHFLLPAGIAYSFFRRKWVATWTILCMTMLVDLDHLLADPLFDPNRCSIGFHPLHTLPAILAYAILLLPKKTRLVALGLWIHMALDMLDCLMM